MQKHVFISIRTRLAVWLLFILIATALGVITVVSSANQRTELTTAEQVLVAAATQFTQTLQPKEQTLPADYAKTLLLNTSKDLSAVTAQLQQLNAELASSFVVLMNANDNSQHASLTTLSNEHRAKIQSVYQQYQQLKKGQLLLLDPQIYAMQWLDLGAGFTLGIAMPLPLRFAEPQQMFGVSIEILRKNKELSEFTEDAAFRELAATLPPANDPK